MNLPPGKVGIALRAKHLFPPWPSFSQGWFAAQQRAIKRSRAYVSKGAPVRHLRFAFTPAEWVLGLLELRSAVDLKQLAGTHFGSGHL